MKPLIRLASQLVLACASILVASSAWADKPIDIVRGPLHFGPFPFVDCTQLDDMDFWIWVEGDTMEEGKMFFDKDGVLTNAIGKNYTLNALSWVPADPGCSVAPFVSCFDPRAVMPGTNTNSSDDNLGGGEHTTAIYREWIYIYDQWFPTWIKYSGLNLHIRIPGYGNIFANAGTLIEQFNFETFEWDVIKMTPNWDNWKAKDVFAMCSYHGNQ